MLYFCLYCDAWIYWCSCMGSMSVSSCICFMSVSCVHDVCSSQCCIMHDLQFVNAGQGLRGDHIEEANSRAGLMTAL